MKVKYKFVLIAGVASLLLSMALKVAGLDPAMSTTAGITLLIAVLWLTEAFPIAVTALIPFVAFPMAGIIDFRQASSALGSHVILLLMGAFMLSKALEKSGVHHRLAVYMLRITGTQSARRLVLGFMLTAAGLSMWISNTATALMLMPIALAIISSMHAPALASAILLGIAYAASLGGVGTIIGTPPNIIFMSVYQQATGNEISFLDWMTTGIPIVVLAIPLMALWLTRGLRHMPECELPKVGPWRSAEVRVLVIFSSVALAWVFRPYWSGWLGMDAINDSTVAIAGVLLMFLVPDGDKQNPGQVLDWDTAQQIPWGMLLVFAGGICLANAFSASGLSQVLGQGLEGLSVLPIVALLLILCLAVSFMTEITSNTATATLLMPVLASASVAVGVDPIVLMMPAAISASCAFMMPVATPTNAIVFSSGKISIQTMAKEGAILNVIVAVVVTAVMMVTRV
ncbi:SLC13/DASS family transporter [Alteromonas aestuariivivens]|uniref:SLC13/DASS family transporter n=1 Tax=Alteromonas aestuariivivens TaxID=1938339 RepID=A0A3D8MB60_9ALTE|nr:SLC13 family permease [Alteromonas aestuariivivens]RDV27488.1 SLC13/DASS family transporter [Alteromonas aestuariivivens]